MPAPYEQRDCLVFVIEAPSSKDLYESRSEGQHLCELLRLAGIKSRYHLTADAERFRDALDALYTIAGTLSSEALLLHISAHGNNAGIQLTSGETVTWDQLKQLIMPVNDAVDGRLIVCMSSCEGFSACEMAMEEGSLPFLGIVGHVAKPSWSDTAVAFHAFYHLYAKGLGVEKATEAMRAASGEPGFVAVHGPKLQQSFVQRCRKLNLSSALASSTPRSAPAIPMPPTTEQKTRVLGESHRRSA